MKAHQILYQIAARLERIEQILLEEPEVIFNKDTLDMDEAVTYTKYSKGYLYRLTSRKEIPHFKRGRKVYFDRAQLDEWLREQPIKTQAEIESEADTYCATHKLR